MHGKAVVDEIGAAVKRFVRQKILAQDLIVTSARDFTEIAIASENTVKHVSVTDIEQRNTEIGLQSIIKRSKKIPDIKKNHCLETQICNKSKKIVTHEITPFFVNDSLFQTL